MDYAEFLESKKITIAPSGFTSDSLNPHSFLFQSDITRWALERGKCAIFSDCGTGKTLMALDWAEHVVRHYNKPVLIVAPLAVSRQTVKEGEKFGVKVHLAREQSDIVGPSVYVTNYGKLHHFDPAPLGGVVPDESSIIKHHDSATRNRLIEMFAYTPMKLCCTATAAPNDHAELGNHSEFLGVLTRTEMLSTFFVHDGGDTSKWRLKGHAQEEFWKWVSQWAVMLRQPSDLGYDNNGFVLPPLNYHHHVVKSEKNLDGFLFPVEAQTLTERRSARRVSLSERVELCAALVNRSTEPWMVWVDLNDEGDLLEKLIPEAVQVAGRDSDDDKEERMLGFSDGKYRVLISKSSICGFGMNWQHCSNVAYVGLSDSYERLYQSIRRFWRFGQKNAVNAHIITSEAEGAVVKNIQRKEADAAKMAKEMVKHMSVYNTEAVHGTVRTADTYKTKIEQGEGWEMRLGDCVEQIANVPDDSIHYSIFSPPFASLYTYSASERDMGNARTHAEFYEHFSFLVEELYRVMMPGRLLSFHCMNLPTSKERDGVIGISDFRGDLIRMFCGSEAQALHDAKLILERLGRDTAEIDLAITDASLRSGGFIYHSEVVIWKDPVTAMQRTKALGLLHKQLVKDSCMSRQGIPDYLVTMRKPGENPERVAGPLKTYIGDDPTINNDRWNPELPRPTNETRNSINIWQRYASPIWMDINPSDTLQKESAREDADERHICLAAGSLVLTREYGYLEIEDIEVGDHVLTHRGRWMPVTAKACNGISETIRVCGQGVADLNLTPSHKLWAKAATDGRRSKGSALNKQPEWIEAQRSLGCYLHLPLPPEESSVLTPEEWWIVGRWLGDGHRGGHRRSGKRGGLGQFFISCAHDEVALLTARLGMFAGHASERTATQIALISLRDEVRDVLDRCGSGACNKRLPGEAVTLPRIESESLLEGYLSADGCYIGQHDRFAASSVSRGLLLGMAIVAQRARDVVASVYAGRPERKGEIEGRQVNMLQDWIFAFRDSDGYRKSGWIDESGAWKKVRKVETAEDAEVWDLQVDGDASFVAEGAVVHNCPLQLQVIERAIDLWTNPSDLVLDPFMGIGSVGYTALRHNRRTLGFELKESYYKQAVANLRSVESATQEGLFAMASGD